MQYLFIVHESCCTRVDSQLVYVSDAIYGS